MSNQPGEVTEIYLYIGDGWRYTFSIRLDRRGEVTVTEMNVFDMSRKDPKKTVTVQRSAVDVRRFFEAVTVCESYFAAVNAPPVVPDSTTASIVISRADAKSSHAIPVEHVAPFAAQTTFPHVNKFIDDLFALGQQIIGNSP